MNLSLLPVLFLSGLAAGAPLAVLGIALSLVLNVARRFHFAFGVTYTLGGFVSALLSTDLGVPPILAIVAAMITCAAVGAGIELLVYRPLAERSVDGALLPIFVSSLGIAIAGESAIQFLFANQASAVPFNLIDDAAVALPLGLRTTQLDLTSMAVFGVVAAVAVLLLRFTRVGRIVRAVRGNPTMARAVGIRPDLVVVMIFILSSAAAALAASFDAARYAATPGMGYDALFSGFVVAFLGGSSAPALRLVLIALGLGVVQTTSTLLIPANLTDVVVFGILFVYLAMKAAAKVPLGHLLSGGR